MQLQLQHEKTKVETYERRSEQLVAELAEKIKIAEVRKWLTMHCPRKSIYLHAYLACVAFCGVNRHQLRLQLRNKQF